MQPSHYACKYNSIYYTKERKVMGLMGKNRNYAYGPEQMVRAGWVKTMTGG